MDIDEQIAALKAEKARLEREKENAKLAAWAAFKPEFEWRVRPQHGFMRIDCRYDKASQEEHARLVKEYGDAPSRRDPAEWNGMAYVLSHDGYLVQCGGGSVVIATDPGVFTRTVKLTESEMQTLLAGTIPMRIRKGW